MNPIAYFLGAGWLLTTGALLYVVIKLVAVSNDAVRARSELADRELSALSKENDAQREQLLREKAAQEIEVAAPPGPGASAKEISENINRSLDALSRVPLPPPPRPRIAHSDRLPGPRAVPGPATGKDPKKGG